MPSCPSKACALGDCLGYLYGCTGGLSLAWILSSAYYSPECAVNLDSMMSHISQTVQPHPHIYEVRTIFMPSAFT